MVFRNVLFTSRWDRHCKVAYCRLVINWWLIVGDTLLQTNLPAAPGKHIDAVIKFSLSVKENRLMCSPWQPERTTQLPLIKSPSLRKWIEIADNRIDINNLSNRHSLPFRSHKILLHRGLLAPIVSRWRAQLGPLSLIILGTTFHWNGCFRLKWIRFFAWRSVWPCFVYATERTASSPKE